MRTNGHDHRGACARRWSLLLVVVLLAAPGMAAALGLGKLQLISRLNQPFEARIPLLSVKAEELDRLKVSLADADTLMRAGIVSNDLLLSLRFDVVSGADGNYVRVRSAGSVREPVIGFVVELSWPSGRMLREYSVLLSAP